MAFLSGISPSVYAGGINASSLLSAWGNPPMSNGVGHDTFSTCLGNSLVDDNGNCLNWMKGKKDIDETICGANDGYDEGAIVMLVARDIRQNGARFCPTQLQGANKNRDWSWTEIYDVGGSNKCFWLCKPGFSGEGCEGGVATTCNSMEITKDNMNFSRVVGSATNIESEIPMFYMNWKSDHQESDMILTVKQWLEGGHGAWVSPTIFRAERTGWKDMISTATIKFVGTAVLMCMDGYRPNGTNTDCEAINQDLCNLNSVCPGWTSSDFKASEHVMYKNGDTCYEYRCMMPGYGFVSASDRTCKECNENAQYGVPQKTGVCVFCPVEKIFDENASDSGYCVTAAQIGTGTMQYGPQKSRTTKPLLNQCWTQVEPSTYKSCVTDPKWEYKPAQNTQ